MASASFSHSRVLNQALRQRIMSADEAAALIQNGDSVGMSGFTGSGYPKQVPMALARRVKALREKGETLRIGLLTGASTGPELDGELGAANAVEYRVPYNSDPELRKRINNGEANYSDIHLSHLGQQVEFGFFGKLNVAVIEVTAIYEDGRCIPSTSVGNNNTWIEQADKVILEVNEAQSLDFEGMHDIYYDWGVPPNRKVIPLTSAGQRIGSPYLHIPIEKVVAVVETNSPDRNSPFKEPDEGSKRIAGHILDFLAHEVKKGRLPADLLPLQSGVGNIANAVLHGLTQGQFNNLTSYTEVIQDGMIALIKSGKMLYASATAFSLSPEMIEEVYANIKDYKNSIILRSQEISNNPGIIRRIGVIAMNAMIEGDIYGNVNSTHIMGSKIQNGIGGSGDFARNARLTFFMAPSLAGKNGSISTIVPMVNHVDHTEHDTHIIVTDKGLADLRGLSPKQRARVIIDNCASDDYKPLLNDYFERAKKSGNGMHTPHMLDEAFSMHTRFMKTGSMKQ
jgi:succinyl-CoA:acetate CoA-transferase